MHNREKGNVYEQYAVNYLESKGHRILARNYRSRFGEIDIISRQNSYIIFHEVKYRKNNQYGYPAESVTSSKQQKIRKTAEIFMYQNRIDLFSRFDIIAIDGNNKITHIENAF